MHQQALRLLRCLVYPTPIQHSPAEWKIGDLEGSRTHGWSLWCILKFSSALQRKSSTSTGVLIVYHPLPLPPKKRRIPGGLESFILCSLSTCWIQLDHDARPLSGEVSLIACGSFPYSSLWYINALFCIVDRVRKPWHLHQLPQLHPSLICRVLQSTRALLPHRQAAREAGRSLR